MWFKTEEVKPNEGGEHVLGYWGDDEYSEAYYCDEAWFCDPEYALPTTAPICWTSSLPVTPKEPTMNFKQYRRKQIAELADWTPDFDMSGVSVSVEDQKAGSPREGDKIARNPKNHADRWLVAAQYFADNFEPACEVVEPFPPITV